MLSICRKTLTLELESFSMVEGKFNIKTGQICFDSSDDSEDIYSNAWAQIAFRFSGYNLRIPKESGGALYITRLMVDLKTHAIYTIDPDTYERIELGTMPEFKTPEEAIGILEKFIEDLKEKYKGSV